MLITNISEAKTNLSYLIKQVQETSEPIIIGKAGEPVAILSAFNKDLSPRQLGGSWEGKVKISPEFDDTNEEIANSFHDSTIFPIES